MENKIRVAIRNLVEQGKRDFVIYPFGNYGRMAKEILNAEFGIEELYVVDKRDLNSLNIKYKDINGLRDDYISNDGFMILMAVDPVVWDTSSQVHRNVMEFAEVERVADVLAWSPYFTPWNHNEKINLSGKPKMAALECIAREIYRNEIPGAVAEAGVFQGQTARYINLLFPDRKLYLFDTFEGFSKKDQDNDDKRELFNLKLDFSQTSEKLVLDRMHFVDNCIVKKGWFPESASGLEEKFSFVRLDMDLYDPIYAGLEYFYPRMEKGGYILVHDCRSKNFDGARMALIDFCKKENLGYMCMPDNLGSAIICVGM